MDLFLGPVLENEGSFIISIHSTKGVDRLRQQNGDYQSRIQSAKDSLDKLKVLLTSREGLSKNQSKLPKKNLKGNSPIFS